MYHQGRGRSPSTPEESSWRPALPARRPARGRPARVPRRRQPQGEPRDHGRAGGRRRAGRADVRLPRPRRERRLDGAGRLAGRRRRRRTAARRVRRAVAGGARGQHGRHHAAAAGGARPAGLLPLLALLCPADGASLLAGLDELAWAPDAGPGGSLDGPLERECRRPARTRLHRPLRRGRPAAVPRGARPDRGRARQVARADRPRARRRRGALRAQREAGGRPGAAVGAHRARRGRSHRPGRSPLVARATIDWATANGG